MINPSEVNPQPTRVSKLTYFICAFMGLMSFINSLPKFRTFIIFKPKYLFSPFPMPWTFFTSSFINESLIFLIITFYLFVQFARNIEPIYGTKEYLHFIVILTFYSNLFLCLILLILSFLFMSTSLMNREFDTSNIIFSGIGVAIAHTLFEQEMNIFSFVLKFRFLPFYFLLFLIFFFVVRED